MGRRRSRVALAGAVALTVAAAGCASDTTDAGSGVGSPAPSTTAPTAGTTAPPTTAGTTTTIEVPPGTVVLHDYEIAPPTIDVAVGGTVTWQNTDDVDHAMLAEDGTTIATGKIAPSGTATVTFATAGTYPYFCDIHNAMKGTVVVG